MEKVSFTINGNSPLLMHAPTAVDTLGSHSKDMKLITAKRVKTDADQEELRRLEWRGNLYYDAKIGPYIPGANLERMLRDAAKISKQGRVVERGLHVTAAMNALLYEGPRDVKDLYIDEFIDARVVVNPSSRARIIRTRPVFYEWSLTFPVVFDEKLLDLAMVRGFVLTAGDFIGLGDFRPTFGRFELED